MGEVWEAEQERPRRRVALKVMRRDHAADQLHERMFQREAEALYREVLAVKVDTAGRGHIETAYTLQDLACLYRDSGRYAELKELFDEVFEIQQASWGPDHRWSHDALGDYLWLLRAMGDEDAAAVTEARIHAIEAS